MYKTKEMTYRLLLHHRHPESKARRVRPHVRQRKAAYRQRAKRAHTGNSSVYQTVTSPRPIQRKINANPIHLRPLCSVDGHCPCEYDGQLQPSTLDAPSLIKHLPMYGHG